MSKQETGSHTRNRSTMRDRIHEIAMRQFAEQGAAGLSMSAIAREIGVSQPALFRHVENRDALITDLVITTYEDFISEMTMSPSLAPVEKVRMQGRAMRTWALSNPHHYQLIFGTPIPGYAAPRDRTKEVDERLFHILIGQFSGLHFRSAKTATGKVLDQWATDSGIPNLGGSAVQQAFNGWTRLHGILSLELAGHFTERLPDASLLYESELETLVRELEESVEP